ncbi:MAG: hypothetical protein JWO00_160 [Candidatus Parcubacteria bacterium]|nr:hypothetical protein [Candidatus Parcubacteria bacterium]
MKNKETIYIVACVIILIVMAGGAYWYFLMGPAAAPQPSTTTGTSTGFQPLGRTPGQATGTTSGTTTSSTGTTTTSVLATLRLLSTTPVGGYGASTTARTTIVRWVDRGRGNVYEASYDSSAILTVSNTVVPKIYESAWNRNLTAFVGSIFSTDNLSWTAVYSQLVPQSSTTVPTAVNNPSGQTALAPFALRGKRLPDQMITYAISPKKDRLFMLVNENGSGVGYVSTIDGSNVTRIFTTPLTQVHAEWPTDNSIAITTNGSAGYTGFLYFVSPKTGVWTKILGPLLGLSTVSSHDGKYVLYSYSTNAGAVATNILSIAQTTSMDAGVRTLADKCAWGNNYTTVVYCAVPSQMPSGTYPDDWYKGTISTVDKVWQIDAPTGNTTLVSSLIDHADRSIDAFNLGLEATDGHLFFMNKNDLSLWSLDITKTR